MEINKNNYFDTESSLQYFGASQFKAFRNCEASALAETKGEYQRDPSASQLVGSYVDAYFSNELPEFVADHPEIYTKNGALKADFKKGDAIIDRIERDKLFMDFLDGEKQRIMVGEIFGYPFKIKIDAYHEHDKIVDLKVMKDMKPVYKDGEYKSFVDAWGYDIQGFIYQSVVEYNTGEKLPFYLAVATKEPHTDIGIIEIPQWRLDSVGVIVKHYLPRFDAVKRGEIPPSRCERCGYCRDTKVLNSFIAYEDLLERN